MTSDTIRPMLEKASDGITVTEAAERLGLHEQTIRNWIKSGLLPATRFGGDSGKLRIDPQDVDALRRPAHE